MPALFQSIRSKIIHAKIFSQRGISYISIINSSMILFILLSNLEKYNININIARWFFPILALGILMITFIGYIEDKVKLSRLTSEASF